MEQHRIRFQPLPSSADQIEDVHLHLDYDGDLTEISLDGELIADDCTIG